MAARYVNVDRETPMLLPPDLREWVAKDDLVRFILDAVETCDLSQAKVNRRGSGNAQYPPGMMLSLLIYCYANRIFSSRQIEQATYAQVSVRYLCANEHPDHDTIAAFRRENQKLLESCFVAVLLLAKELKAFGKLGTVSVDGTKLGARASRQSNRKINELEEEIATLQTEIQGLLVEAERADAEDVSRRETLSEKLQDGQTRRSALQAAKAKLQVRQEESRRERREQAKGGDSEEPSPPSCPPRGGKKKEAKQGPAKRDAQRTINLVDEESRLMRDAHGTYLQGYNAQFVVEAGAETRSQLILGVQLTNHCNDRRALADGLEQVPVALRAEISHVVADTGYDNADLIAAVEKQHDLTVLCPPQSPGKPPKRKYRLKRIEVERKARAEAMRTRLKEPEMKKLYARRSASVEPVIGVLKNVMGFRRFRLFGLVKSKIELTLVAIAYNLRHLAQMGLARAS